MILLEIMNFVVVDHDSEGCVSPVVESSSGKVRDAEVGGVRRWMMVVAQHSWQGQAGPEKQIDGKRGATVKYNFS